MQEITPVRWRRIESLLDELLEMPSGARADHLDRVCAADDELRTAVERLLAADDAMEGSAGAAAANPAAAIIAHLARGALGTLGLDLRSQLQRALGDAYHIERELPPGGMGRLFLATESSIGRRVVIKVLPPELANATTAARFRREMEVAARLQHPHILPVLQAAARDKLLYYVMPYVEGQSLRHQLSTDRPMDVSRGVRLIAEIADALAYAHAHGIVHRDVKPDNILVAGGHAMLTDFGVARAIAGEGHQSLTATGASLGTPGYMAPEQIMGSGDVDGRADIYALGIVGYEMLAGSRPFAAVTPAAEFGAQISTVAPPLSQQRADVPRGVSDAIQRALATDPDARFQTAAEFRDALLSGSTPIPSRSRLFSPATLGAVTAVAAAVLAALLWPRTPATTSNPRNSFIVFPFRSSLNDPASGWLEGAASNLIGLSLSHWQELRVFDDERTASLLRRAGVQNPATFDFDVAQRVARQARVGTMILGDIARAGDSLIITAKVHDVESGERIATEVVHGAFSNDPRPLFDSVATRLLRLSDAAVGVPSDVVAHTTRSLEAYRAYLEGTRQMYLGAGVGGGLRLFEKAIALDSNFALAYVQLANAESRRYGGGDTTRRRALVLRAAQLGAKLPPRARMLVDLQIAMHDKRFAQARALGAQLVALDSTDAEAWNWRGEVEMRSGPTRLPRADSLGDLAAQIRYMRRSLELDSAFSNNYFPLIRALVGCASPEASWVCFRDSTVYGASRELRVRLGGGTVDSLRAEAWQQILPMFRGWMTASANLAAPRPLAMYVLVMLGYADEADAQLTRFRLLGGDSIVADFHEMHVRMAQYRVREAAAIAAALVRLPPNEVDSRFQAFEPRVANIAAAYLAGAGRFDEVRSFLRRINDPARMPATSGDTIRLSDPLRRVYIEGTLGAAYTTDARVARESLRGFYGALRTEFSSESSQMPALVTMNPAPIVAYTQTRDTLILHDWMAAAAGVFPSRGAEALLLLARGDTAAARMLAARFFDAAPFPERALIPAPPYGPFPHFSLESHLVADAFAWGDALSQLGDRRHAVQAYAKLDRSFLHDFRADPKWLLRVRSWYERGRLYEQLRDTANAAVMYQRFVDAWHDADAPLQPMVREARAGLARLGRHVRD